MWWLWLVPAAALACYFRPRRESGHVHVITFANSKGGVGKSTLAFLIAREYARQNPTQNVLVLNCSAYSDVKRLAIGGRQAPTVQSMFRGCCGRSRLQTAASDRICNLHVVDSDGTDLSDSACLRTLLESDGRKWTVFVDTDGGGTTGLTRCALKAADTVVIPTHTNDCSRIFHTVATVNSLKKQGYCKACYGVVLFNKVRVKQNEPNSEIVPFTMHDADVQQMEHSAKVISSSAGMFDVGKPRYVLRELGKFGTQLYHDPYGEAPSGFIDDIYRLPFFRD